MTRITPARNNSLKELAAELLRREHDAAQKHRTMRDEAARTYYDTGILSAAEVADTLGITKDGAYKLLRKAAA